MRNVYLTLFIIFFINCSLLYKNNDRSSDSGETDSINGKCIDNDGDEYFAKTQDCENGNDCDDNNSYIHPGARDICGDGIDADCSGGDTVCTKCKFTKVDINVEQSRGIGAGFIDFNNDGYLDIFVVNAEQQQDFLYRNYNTSFTSIGQSYGIEDSSNGRGISSGDYDNDGDIDIYVANEGEQDFLYRNDGTAFTQVAHELGIIDTNKGRGVTTSDYDNDGDLDIFVANEGEQDFLYRNDGTTFTQIASQIGIVDQSNGLGVVSGDYDNDGDLDIFVANYDGERDNLYKNSSGAFSDIASLYTGINDNAFGVGAAFGDYDNDGDLDIFVANNNGENDFLYRNDSGVFTEVAQTSGITDSSDGNGVAFGDYDNDGDLDIFVANNNGENDFLYQNDNGIFTEVAQTLEIIDSSNGNGVAFGDYDNDGDLDIFVTNDDQDFLYRNECPSRSYLQIRPMVQNNNKTYRDAIGAAVYVDLDADGDFSFPDTLMQQVGGGSSLSQNQIWLNFGLGLILRDVSVKIVFPGPGTIEDRTITYKNVPISERLMFYKNGVFNKF